MLAGSTLRVATRPTFGLLPILRRRPLAAYTTSSRFFDPSVSAVGYQRGNRMEQEIDVRAAHGTGPVKPPGSDSERTAMTLNENVYSLLTSTLSKFTLRDKVAVVTG